LGPIGSAVLTFIGYKQTNRQTNKQTDKPNFFIDKENMLIVTDRATIKNELEEGREAP